MLRAGLALSLVVSFAMHAFAAEDASKPKLRPLLERPKQLVEKLRSLVPMESNPSPQAAQDRPNAVPSPPAEAAPKAERRVESRKRIVVNLRYGPAADLGRAITDLLQRERSSAKEEITIVPDAIGNRLLISATPPLIAEITQLVEQLDTKPPSVVVRLTIAELRRPADQGDAGGIDLTERSGSTAGKAASTKKQDISKVATSREDAEKLIDSLQRAAGIKFLGQAHIVAVDNQAAFVQVGERAPRATRLPGRSEGAPGAGGPTSVTYQDSGLIVGVTPRISPDDSVTLNVDVEKSNMPPESDEGTTTTRSNLGAFRAPRMETTSIQTTVSIPAGQALILGGLATRSAEGRSQLLVIVVPQVLR